MGRKYANPPIVEAVCEFRLGTDTQWDLTLPGLVYEKVKDEFPYREQRVAQEMIIEVAQGVQQKIHTIHTIERVLFFAEGRRLFIQLGTRILTVNHLDPYPGWAGLRPKIQKAWQSLIETVEVKSLERIGLRYINRITIDPNRNTLTTSQIKLKDYFEFYPFLGEKLPQEMVNFITGSEFAYADGRDRCRVQITPESIGSGTFFLDIDYFLAQPKGVAVMDVLTWVDEAHDRIEAIFEGCITDRLRELFGEVRA